jgi:hypothetical protein
MADVKPYSRSLTLEEAAEALAIAASIPKEWRPEIGEVTFLVTPVKVFRDFGEEFDVCDDEGNCTKVPRKALLKYFNQQTIMKAMKDAILKIAKQLLKANNTVTTLEIKTELRRDYPYFHSPQSDVSAYMDQLAGDGIFTYTDNGTYRTYSLATPAQVAATAGPVSKRLKQPHPVAVVAAAASRALAKAPRKRGRPRKLTTTSVSRSTAQSYVVADNFDSLTIGGTIVTRADIRLQKKSPKGYLSNAKLNKLDAITVNGNTYSVN